MKPFRRIHLFFRTKGIDHAPVPMTASLVWSPQNSLSPEALYIAGALLLAVALLLTVLHRRQRTPEASCSPLEDPAFIAATFQHCADHRLRISLTCSRDKLSSTQASGYLLPLEESRPHAPLVFALSEVRKIEEWAEAPVDVYFHTTVGNEKTFYHFSSFVQSLLQSSGEWHLTLAHPSALTHNQRREFVRVTPPAGAVEGITAWPLPEGPLLALPTGVQSLGSPPFAFRPPRILLLEIMDISAGGVGLRVPVEQVRAKQVRCAPGVRFVVLLALDAQRADSSHQMLWLAATVRRAMMATSKTHVELGLQFSHWALATALTDPIHWEPVEPDGEVPFLLRWVSRINALLARTGQE